MLRQSVRSFGTSLTSRASSAKAFSKNSPSSYQPRKKRITGNCLYKPFEDTVSTSKFNLKAPKIETEVYSPQKIDKCINSVTEYDTEHLKTLFKLGTFKHGQHNELFRSPISLIRDSSTKKLLENLAKPNSKFVITGEQGIGKTTLLAQMQAALTDSHIIIHISHPALFLNGQTDFLFDKNLKSYTNPMCVQSLLKKVLKTNESFLKEIKLANSYNFQVWDSKTDAKGLKDFVKGEHTLYDLISIKTSPEFKGRLFANFIEELKQQAQYPVALTMDNFSRLVSTSLTAYKNVNCKNIPTLQFQLPQTIFDIISGDIKFGHEDSKVILAMTGGHKHTKTLPTALGKYVHDPYLTKSQYDQEFTAKLKKGGLQEFEVPRLSSDEVAVLLDYYKKVGVAKETHSADEKYLVSGNGNPLALIKSITMNFY